MTHVAKIIEIVGSSDKSWERQYMGHGIEVKDMTATVDTNTGKISQFRAGVKVSFGIEH